MKKKIIIIVAVALVAVLALGIWASIYRPFDTSLKNVTVVVIDDRTNTTKTFKYRTNLSNLGDLVREKEEFGCAYSNGAYGMYITSVFDNPISGSQYVGILCDDEEYIDKDSKYNVTLTAPNGAICVSSTVGADGLALVNGKTYIITVITF